MPFPTTRVIPEHWSQHHAPVAAGGMNATVTVTDPNTATSTWNPDTESQDWTPGPAVYDGPGRVQAIDTASETTQATQDVTERRYLIQLLKDAPHIEQGWTVQVTQCANDTDLVAVVLARPMAVKDVQHGSERFTRDLICTLNQD